MPQKRPAKSTKLTIKRKASAISANDPNPPSPVSSTSSLSAIPESIAMSKTHSPDPVILRHSAEHFVNRDFALCSMESCTYKDCVQLLPDDTFGTKDCEFQGCEFEKCSFEGCTFVLCRHYDVGGLGVELVAVNEHYTKMTVREKGGKAGKEDDAEGEENYVPQIL